MSRRWEEVRREKLGEHWDDLKHYHEAFHWLVEWYEPLYEADARPLIQKGLTKRQIEKVAQEFNSNVSSIITFISDLY